MTDRPKWKTTGAMTPLTFDLLTWLWHLMGKVHKMFFVFYLLNNSIFSQIISIWNGRGHWLCIHNNLMIRQSLFMIIWHDLLLIFSTEPSDGLFQHIINYPHQNSHFSGFPPNYRPSQITLTLTSPPTANRKCFFPLLLPAILSTLSQIPPQVSAGVGTSPKGATHGTGPGSAENPHTETDHGTDNVDPWSQPSTAQRSSKDARDLPGHHPQGREDADICGKAKTTGEQMVNRNALFHR